MAKKRPPFDPTFPDGSPALVWLGDQVRLWVTAERRSQRYKKLRSASRDFLAAKPILGKARASKEHAEALVGRICASFRTLPGLRDMQDVAARIPLQVVTIAAVEWKSEHPNGTLTYEFEVLFPTGSDALAELENRIRRVILGYPDGRGFEDVTVTAPAAAAIRMAQRYARSDKRGEASLLDQLIEEVLAKLLVWDVDPPVTAGAYYAAFPEVIVWCASDHWRRTHRVKEESVGAGPEAERDADQDFDADASVDMHSDSDEQSEYEIMVNSILAGASTKRQEIMRLLIALAETEPLLEKRREMVKAKTGYSIKQIRETEKWFIDAVKRHERGGA